jgi:nucleotide-binding universal stress UspA family protein
VTGAFRRILVAHDFSRHADRALATALALARRHGAALTVLHVASPIALRGGFPPTASFSPPTAAMLAAIGERLEERVRRVRRARDVRPTVRVAVGDPRDVLLEVAAGYDLVVAGTHGLTGVSHLVIGSVAERLVRHAPVPVLTVRAAGRRARPA